jgi:hypothetical protein
MGGCGVEYSEIGLWSEAKLDIIAKYAKAYSRILTKQKIFTHVYVDAFAKLVIVDDSLNGNSGSISGGWSLIIDGLA